MAGTRSLRVRCQCVHALLGGEGCGEGNNIWRACASFEISQGADSVIFDLTEYTREILIFKSSYRP